MEQTGLTVGGLASWLADQDPDQQLVFAFRDGEGVVWRYASDLRFDLYSTPWFDPDGRFPQACIEIDTTDEFQVVPA